MPYVTRPGVPGERGFDTSQPNLTGADGVQLLQAGYTFGVRYIQNAAPSPDQPPIGTQELAALTGAGLGIMLVQYARATGWSVQTGTADGQAAAKNALALGVPPTATLWFDYALQGLSVADATAYADACFDGAVAGGMSPAALGGYFEPGVPLSDSQLYALKIGRYWRSGAIVPNVAHRGYQLLQLWPADILIPRNPPGKGNLEIDIDVVQQDYEKDVPLLIVSG
jgi:hypothetical protein